MNIRALVNLQSLEADVVSDPYIRMITRIWKKIIAREEEREERRRKAISHDTPTNFRAQEQGAKT